MIVQCDECSAKFRLDDSKIKDGGVKVRCSKCKHVFVVQPEASADEADYDSFLAGLESTPEAPPQPDQTPAQPSAATAGEGQDTEGVDAAPAAEQAPAVKEEFDFGEFAFDAGSGDTQADSSPISEESGFDLKEFDTAPAPPEAGALPSFDFGEFDLQSSSPPPAGGEPADTSAYGEFDLNMETPTPTSVETTASASFDFGEFEMEESTPSSTSEPAGDTTEATFGEVSLEEGPPAASSAPEDPAATDGFDFGDFDFSTEEESVAASEGGEATPATPPVPPALPDAFFSSGEPVVPSITIGEPGDMAVATSASVGMPHEDVTARDDAPFEFAFEPDDGPAASPSASAPTPPAASPPAFDFGDFSFGEESASESTPHVTPSPEKGPLPEETLETAALQSQDFLGVELAADEPPPLSISSRRRGGSLPIAVIAVVVLLVLVVGGAGYVLSKEGAGGLNRIGLGFMAKWLGGENREDGAIAVRNTAAAFLQNQHAGELFVINGEAVNNFRKPRASVQVRATLFGPKGETLAQKNVYCGNSLSREQLTTMAAAEFEKAMANQFGDSLSNLSVPPGKAIPFVAVFTNVPKGATDFGIEVVGSTTATK